MGSTLLTMLLVTLLLQAVLSQAASPYCPEGWTDALTLDMGCLYLIQEGLDWESATERCRNLGGEKAHLVEIQNAEQLTFLQQGLHFADGTNWSWHNYWWTGANDRAQEGSWIWAESRAEVPDFLWASDQPDNCTPNNSDGSCVSENCGALVITGQGNYDQYYMVDMPCEWDLYYKWYMYSVCQIAPF